MKQMLEHILSPVTQAMVALPMVAWMLAAVYILGIPYEAAAGTIAVRTFFFAVTAMVGASAIASVRTRAYSKAMVQAGISLLLIQGIGLQAFGFHCTMSIGVGEATPQFTSIEAGPLASVPAIPIALVSAQTGTTTSARIVDDAGERTIASGQSTSWRDYDLKLTVVAHAPLLVLSDLKGKELDAGYIKLNPGSAEPTYFQFPVNPHRIYVSPDGWSGEEWKKKGGTWEQIRPHRGQGYNVDDPEALVMTIMRGKLRIAGGVVKQGTSLPFNEYSVRFEKGLPWAEFKVTKRPAFASAYAGITLVVVGAATRLLARRSA